MKATGVFHARGVLLEAWSALYAYIRGPFGCMHVHYNACMRGPLRSAWVLCIACMRGP